MSPQPKAVQPALNIRAEIDSIKHTAHAVYCELLQQKEVLQAELEFINKGLAELEAFAPKLREAQGDLPRAA